MEKKNVPIGEQEIKGLSLKVAVSILISLITIIVAGAMWYSDIMASKKNTDVKFEKLEKEFEAYRSLKAMEDKTQDNAIDQLKLKVNTLEALQRIK